MRRGVGHAEGAVYTAAVIKLSTIWVCSVAPVAHVSGSEAVPHGDIAAVAALPVNVGLAMDLAFALPGSVSLQLAVLASQVLLLSVLF